MNSRIYRQYRDREGRISNEGITREVDETWPAPAFIPNDPDNRDWREFQEWLSRGNVPLPPDDN